MKDVTAGCVYFFSRRGNCSRRRHKITFVRPVQRQFDDDDIVVEVEALEFSVYVRKSGRINVDRQANVRAIELLTGGDVIEISALREQRHKLRCLLGGCFSEMVQTPDQLLIAILLSCLD